MTTYKDKFAVSLMDGKILTVDSKNFEDYFNDYKTFLCGLGGDYKKQFKHFSMQEFLTQIKNGMNFNGVPIILKDEQEIKDKFNLC
jgi:hypothetical protein